ncbi:MAG: dTDP-4-dehydrorhamnose 3,5-epimerase [Candidatus Gastranaerophilales bacterium]|nr:dTDP-4-dehydrorhamnose 3,5-epimerase [Candidatus Gastranaerophilales bacterium]
MKITPLKINGAFLIEMEEYKDERGSFARQFCKEELKKYGIDFDIKQCNLSKNISAGVLRGLHYQKEPYPEIKMVSCFKGRIFDVLADIRKDSPTYLQWVGTELSEHNGKMLYIPSGVAHGFQTLEDDSYVYYQLGEFFKPEYYMGVRWNDQAFGIEWPDCKERIMNERDKNYDLWE